MTQFLSPKIAWAHALPHPVHHTNFVLHPSPLSATQEKTYKNHRLFYITLEGIGVSGCQDMALSLYFRPGDGERLEQP